MSDPSSKPGFTDADATYAAIVDALEAAGDEGATAFLSRLVLLLAAEVKGHERIAALVAQAARGSGSTL